jgi:SAM-dependent methyltransferase
MLKRPVTQADFDRLEDARLAADRLYNEALTALDRAIPPAPSAGPPEPAPYDAREVTPLNESWRVTPEAPVSRGMRGGLARAVWRVVSPWLARQEAFNARLVAHLNGNVRHEQEVATAVASALRAAGEQATALATFHSRLIVFLQQVTPYVDTKDRSVLGHLALVDEQAINAVADELLRRSEAMQAREARFAADVHALKAAHEEMRSTFATLYQATFTVKRELERLVGSVRDPSSVRLQADPDPGGVHAQADRDPRPLDSWKYVGFEDHFRGAREDIRGRLAEYVPLFTGAADVLDVGCGRGEFLDLLREAGISARGLDPNHEMVEVCRARGLVAEETDVLRFLRAAPDGSLGGLLAAQVIEHLEPEYLMRTLEAAYHALRPGSRLVLETINPACWTAFFESYIRDLTHVRPIHPETLQYLLTASGFQRIEIQYRSPLPERERLQTVTVPRDASPSIREAFETLNENAGRLNERLFSHMDYAAVAVRL